MLHLKLLEARNLSRRDLFSKSDPYCILSIGSQQATSNVVMDNQSPVWNQQFSFHMPSQQLLHTTDLIIRVVDYDAFSSHEQLGVASIPLSSLQFVQNQWIDKWIPLSSARRGEIHIQLKMEPIVSSAPLQSMNYGMQQPTINPGMHMMPQQTHMGMMPMQSATMMMQPQQPMYHSSSAMPMQSQTMGNYGMMPPQQMTTGGMMMQPQQQSYMQPQQMYSNPSTMYPSMNRGFY